MILETQVGRVRVGCDAADRHKSTAFTEIMEVARNSMVLAMTGELLKELKARGFDAQLLEGVARPPASPDDIDYPQAADCSPRFACLF